MSAKRTTIYLDDCDRQALSTLQERYGLVTLSDAIRFAARTLAAQPISARPFPSHPAGVSVPASSDSPVGPGTLPSVPREGRAVRSGDDEKVEFLMEELLSTQELLAQEQEERVKLQEELARSYREVQVLNQAAPLERSTGHEREGDDPTRVPVAPGDRRSAALKALVAASRHRFAQVLQANVPLRAENRRLLRKIREERVRRWASHRLP